MDLTLNQKLRFEFSDLDLKGTKIESFYKKRFQVFLFKNTRELSVSQKLEAILTHQIEEKSEIEIQDNLSEKTFIQGELIRSEHYLNDITIDDNLREKLNLWIDYLKQNAKHKLLPQRKKDVEPFVNFLKNIPENKKEIFAEALKNDFPNATCINIRYMIEALKIVDVLKCEKRQGQKLFNSLTDYFGRNIGSYESIFTMPKLDIENRHKPGRAGALHYSYIQSAKGQIDTILKKHHIKVK